VERWYGATGRRVPADALILDAWKDHADELHEAHERGVPVVIRANTPEEIKEALARPEVACVLVRDPALLQLDLVKLTYG